VLFSLFSFQQTEGTPFFLVMSTNNCLPLFSAVFFPYLNVSCGGYTEVAFPMRRRTNPSVVTTSSMAIRVLPLCSAMLHTRQSPFPLIFVALSFFLFLPTRARDALPLSSPFLFQSFSYRPDAYSTDNSPPAFYEVRFSSFFHKFSFRRASSPSRKSFLFFFFGH